MQALGAVGITSGRNSKITYPQGTYADLLFSDLLLDNASLHDAESIALDIPTARIDGVCAELINGIDFTSTLKVNTEEGEHEYSIRIAQDMSCSRNVDEHTAYSLVDVTPENQYFALILQYHLCKGEPGRGEDEFTDLGEMTLWWSRSYAWGKVFPSIDGESMVVDHISVWRCNYSWAEVTTTTTLIPEDNGSFHIDYSLPPVPDESTVRPWEPPFSVPAFLQGF